MGCGGGGVSRRVACVGRVDLRRAVPACRNVWREHTLLEIVHLEIEIVDLDIEISLR